MKNLYIISGAAGMTGSELSIQLVKRGHTVIGFDNFFASSIESVKIILYNSQFIFKEYDLNNEFEMAEIECLVKSIKHKYNKIIYINCAAVVHTEYFYKVNSTYQTNVASMKKFLNQAINCNADIFINCSSSEVYSMQSWTEKGGVKESTYLLLATSEHSQRTSYAVGKLLTEYFLKDAVDNNLIKGCSIRFANVYSNYEKYSKHIIPYIFNELKVNGKVLLLENSKKNKRTFLHNIDSCKAVIALCDNEIALDGTSYNVATNEEISILNLVNLISSKIGIANPIIEYSGFRLSDPERRLLNTEKIRTKTNWEPTISLNDGLTMYAKNNYK